MKKKSIDPLFAEEEYYKENKREHRRQRKEISLADRSKYKKTDRKMQKKILHPEDASLQKGRVISISGEKISIFSNDKTYICTLRGVLKKDKTLLKNLIAIGDIVSFSPDDLAIYSVADRYTILSRMDNVRQKEHILAVNIDQVFIVVSVGLPPLKPFLIDRYLIAAKKGNMDAIVVINKMDLLENNEEEKKKYLQLKEAFANSNIDILCLSTKTKEGLDLLFAKMKNKTSVFSGQSGVGKTSILNEILSTTMKIGPVVKKTAKGAHVTTSAILLPLPQGGFCIDTPGIKSFGIWQLTKEDIKNHFTEIAAYSVFCKYPDCDHLQEPGCAVQQAVQEGKISSLRFASYNSLIENLKQNTLKR